MAAAANNPYSAEQVVTAAYNLFFKTGIFAEDCKLWRRRIAGDKTWQHFKTYFTMAHQELRESQTTLQDASYHSANNAIMHTGDDGSDLQQDTVDVISNLATATAADCTTVATLIKVNSKLAGELININAKLVKALESNKYLSSKL